MIRRGQILAVFFVFCNVFTSPINAGVWVEPNSFDVNTVEGTVLEETLTIGNDGLGDLDFIIRTRQVGGSIESAGESGDKAAGEQEGIFSIPEGHDFTVAGDAPYEPGKLIVRFAGGTNSELCSAVEKNQILSTLGGTVERDFTIVPGLSVVDLPEDMTVEDALVAFNNTDGILYAEPDYEVHVCSTFPDDPRFDELWGMHNTGQSGGTEDADIDAPEAWDLGTGNGEIVVAVIDTGVDYTHVDLADNMWVNEAEYNGTPGQDDDGNGYIDDIYGYDFRNGDGDPMDDHYHGTHCAGTIGAVGNNGEGVAGVCWNVKIMAVKFLSSGGSGTTEDAIASVEYSTLMGVNLSSNSWGGGGYSQGLKDAIDAAGAAGMLFVAAAGNDNEDTDVYPHYPSTYDCESLISVMATNKNDNKSNFSNYGLISVDLGAPGSDILSCEPGNQYQYLDGTSMATPHVAGACAFLWSMDSTMSNEEIKNILIQTVDNTLSGLCVSGGRLNIHSAILETRAPWIEIEPEEGTVGPGGMVDVNVNFDALELSPEIYEAEIVIISNDPCSPTVVPVTLTVNPDDLVVSPDTDFESSGERGGPFAPQYMTYTLTNNGTASVNWTTSYTEDWLSVEPNEGILEPSDSIDVNIFITSDANLLDPNIYEDTLIFENINSGSIKQRSVVLTVKPPDLFTELFDTSGNDLEGLMITFSPDGSGAYYEACREEVNEFPTEPNGGTFVPLWDDDYAGFLLDGGKEILFYGVYYDNFYIGSNGYITFESGDTEFEPSLENHFNMPRISGLFTDLTPLDGECISYKSLSDRIVVTFEEVPLFGDKDAKNSFQIEMFYADGTIRITWLDIATTIGLAGLSEGYGLPPLFLESDLSKYVPCWPLCDLNRDYRVNFKDFAVLANHWLDKDCDIPYWCGKSDLDFSTIVDYDDISICSKNWLAVEDWWLLPLSHWKFDEVNGTTAYDSAGDNDGTVYGATWTSGQIDGALEFDGLDDYVKVNDSASMQSIDGSTADYTISLWVKTTQSGEELWGQIGIFDRRATDALSGKDDWVAHIYLNEYDAAGFLIRKSANDESLKLDDTVAINDDDWHHIAAVRKGIDYVRLYVDGGLRQDGSTTIDTYTTEITTIGLRRRNSGELFGHFDGKIDDVRIYDRALSAEEIEELYQQGLLPEAYNPNPPDGAAAVDPNVILSWSPGKYATSHDVYFGTNYDDVNDANTGSFEYKGNFDVNSFDPCGLDLLTTYYWRIDEIGGSSIYKGDVWSFTTWIEPNFISWWKFDEANGTTAYDSMGYNDGTVYGATWTTGQIDGALDFDGIDDYVSVFDDSSLNISGAITVSAWVRLNDNIDSQVVVGKVASGGGYFGGGYRMIFNSGTGYSDGTFRLIFQKADGTEGTASGNYGSNTNWDRVVSEKNDWETDVWYHVTGVWDGTTDSQSLTMYVNGVLNANHAASQSIIKTNNSTLQIGRTLYTSPSSQFDGKIDDVRIYDKALSAEKIWEIYRRGLTNKASNPKPSNEATYVDPNTVLSWLPGGDVASHDVYLGTDFNDVNDANTGSFEYKGNFDVNSFDPCGLNFSTTYYWRIDEVNEPNIWKGDVWSFTVGTKSIGWWKFDEANGTTAYDSAGDNDGNVYGATWTSGQIDGALEFDSLGDYVRVNDNPELSPSNITLVAWIYPDDVSHDFQIVGKWTSGDNEYIFDNKNDNDSLRLGIDPGGGSFIAIYSDDAVLTAGIWQQVAVTWDGTNCIFYVNGADVGGGTASGDLRDSDNPIYIGSKYDGSRQFYGKMDDVRIYDEALSAEEIWQIYQNGLNN